MVDGSVTWYFVAYDQLNHDIFPWSNGDRTNNGLILIESKAKGNSLNYHKQKLALLLSNMRHFAKEAEDLGHPVMYRFTDGNYHDELTKLCHEVGSIKMVNPAERSLRFEIKPLLEAGKISILEHDGWLTKREWFTETVGNEPPFRMDKFYQRVRKETGILMQDGKPMGGKYSFDAENRLPWSGDPPTQEEQLFPIDKIDEAVMQLVNSEFSSHPGNCDLTKVPTTLGQHQQALQWGMG